MPTTRCCNCGTEEQMQFPGGAVKQGAAHGTFIRCITCNDVVCMSCFIPSDKMCGQCLEAATNGSAQEIRELALTLNYGIHNLNPYIRRRSRMIVSYTKELIDAEDENSND